MPNVLAPTVAAFTGSWLRRAVPLGLAGAIPVSIPSEAVLLGAEWQEGPSWAIANGRSGVTDPPGGLVCERRLIGQRRAVPHADPSFGAPNSASQKNLVEIRGVAPRTALTRGRLELGRRKARTMGDRDDAAGQTRGAPARPGVVQPDSCPREAELGAPAALPDIPCGVTTDIAVTEPGQHEDLERGADDEELYDELESVGFDGPKYRAFQDQLARYGVAVLCAWMYTGYIFKLASGHGFALRPTDQELGDLRGDPEIRDELATMTVAAALPRFRKNALAGGGWRPDGGASLTTYFMGACMFVFPNEFRRWRVQQERWRRQERSTPAVSGDPAGLVNDPAAIVAGNLQVREALARAESREAEIVALTIDGYSQEEMAEVLGETSIRAVEGVLYRWRAKEQRRRTGGAKL